MLKRCYYILLLLILISFIIPPVYSASIGTCAKDGKCFLSCIDGDPDCTCAEQNGYICNIGQECNADLLKNWEDKVCCSSHCTNSLLIDGAANIKSLQDISNESSVKETIIKNETVLNSFKVKFIPSTQFQYSMMILLLGLIAFVWFVSFSLHHFGDEVAFVAKAGDKIVSGTKEYGGFLKYEFNKGEEFFKKEFENVKKMSARKPDVKKVESKTDGKVVKLNPLILKILDTLTGDEEKMFKILLDNEGIKKDDLREILGLDRIQFEQALLRLDRKQVIKKKGSEDNYKIYVHDWLK